MNQLKRITQDPAVMGGKPSIHGMRVTAGTVVGLLAVGRTEDEILKAYPYLEKADLREALAYAAWRAEEISSLTHESLAPVVRDSRQARDDGEVVLTHDRDFSATLAAQGGSPWQQESGRQHVTRTRLRNSLAGARCNTGESETRLRQRSP